MTDTERDEFAAIINDNIRFATLDLHIRELTREPLTPKGKRFLEYCMAERDALRLIGLARALYQVPV